MNGYKSWWVEKVSGGTKIGEEILFSFGDNKDLIFKVEAINPLKNINFKCIKGHPEWEETHLKFSLSENEGKICVNFKHTGWKSNTNFMANCNFSWGRYLVSLRDFCEKGIGSPFR